MPESTGDGEGPEGGEVRLPPEESGRNPIKFAKSVDRLEGRWAAVGWESVRSRPMVPATGGLPPLGVVPRSRDGEVSLGAPTQEAMMRNIRHSGGPIIVAVDRSEHAHDSTEWAAELASALGAPLHLVYVAPADARDKTSDTDREANWLGMLRVAAWRAGTDPDVITAVREPLAAVMANLAPGARLVVLGVDLSAHPEMETATVSVLVGRSSGSVAVVRGHRPGLCAPLRGPVVVAGGPVIPDFAVEIAAQLGAPVESVDIGAEDAHTSLTALLDRAHRARLVVLDPPDHLTAPGGWFDDASRLLIEQATCPVVVLGAVDHPVQVGGLAELATAPR